jgi:hypothetical protein
MTEAPRYSFHPLERRGVLLGLGAGQLLTIGAALVAAFVLHGVLPGAPGSGLALLAGTAGVVAGVWSRDQRPVGAWLLDWATFLRRRATSPQLDRRPVSGRRTGALAPPGIVLCEDPGGPGETAVGVISDRHSSTVAAVVPVAGCSFSLLDPVEQSHQLESWRRVLGAVARPGSPVVRLQWVHRTAAVGPGRLEEALGMSPAGDTPEAVSYRRLVQSAVPTMIGHEAWLVLVVQCHRGEGRTRLRRELRLLEGQLRGADLRPGRPLALDELQAVVAGATEARRSRRTGGGWPMATDERWSYLRADGSWHCTYWVAEWPRVEVGPEFLGPLLLGNRRVSVSVLLAPVDPERALREARSARTADLADAELRARAGFIPSIRRDREQQGALAREAELADGHSEFRFTGYLTVSAGDREEMTAACADAEHAAQSARIEIRRLYGRQAEAFTWTLPLGRGLR